MDSVRSSVRDHVVESGLQGALMHARAIEAQINEIDAELIERKKNIDRYRAGTLERKISDGIMLSLIAQRKKLHRQYAHGVYAMMSHVMPDSFAPREGITEEMISRARSFPIEDLIETKKGWAKCVSGTHSDKNPSMDTRNNFAYCYSCGWNGSVIDVAMKVNGWTFVEAVRRMQ